MDSLGVGRAALPAQPLKQGVRKGKTEGKQKDFGRVNRKKQERKQKNKRGRPKETVLRGGDAKI